MGEHRAGDHDVSREDPWVWPSDQPIPLNLIAGRHIVWARVTTPRDQAWLHRYMALEGYCPVIQEILANGDELYRFHHPDSADKP